MRPFPGARCAAVILSLSATLACAPPGREVFVREGCGSCHRFRDLGGGGAPDLTEVRARRDAAWIRRQIRDPRANDPRGSMPAYSGLSPMEIRALASFLTNPRKEHEHPSTPAIHTN